MKQIEYQITVCLELKENTTEQGILDVEKLLTLTGETAILGIGVLKSSHATKIQSYTSLNRVSEEEK